MEDRSGRALEAIDDAARAIAAGDSLDSILQRLVDAGRELTRARYAAAGVPGGGGNFAKFVTSGIPAETAAATGPPPETDGLLGAMLESEAPYRAAELARDPRFRGRWLHALPHTGSFLGVPVVASRGVVGALYLIDSQAAPEFTPEDERLIRTLAAHALIAIENARAHERGLASLIEERNRHGRDDRDSVAERLYEIGRQVEAVATLLDRDSEDAPDHLRNVQHLVQDTIAELSP